MMEKEFSCGSIVYKLDQGKYQFLVIKHKNGNHVSFPKGHMEELETEVQTAKREVFEETGINIIIDETIKDEIVYEPRPNIEKKVTFFLSEAINTDFISQEEEVIETYWLDYDEVLDKLTYESDKEIFINLTSNLKVKKTIRLYEYFIVIFFTLGIVGLTDVLNWGYWYKSAFKISIFLGIPYVYSKLRAITIIEKSNIKKKEFSLFTLLGILVFGFIIAGYFIIINWVDFSNIPNELEKNLGINESNFIYVFLYIPVINALIEEFFFRGFLQKGFDKFFKPMISISISGLLFSIYHVAIMGTWVNIGIVILAILGLFIVGLLFGYIAHKKKSIYPTYIIHFFANLAINTAALFILGII